MALALTSPDRHRIRHIVPTAGAEPGMVPSSQSILGTPYSFRDLPISSIPETTDFSEGAWTARLNDAGSLSITFPNREASDGVPWRNRFSTFGHTEFLEVYRDDVLEQVAVILTAAPSQQAVIVAGQDGWFLLRDAYERDFQCLMAPRDVIERYTYVWTVTVGDNFYEDTELNTGLWESKPSHEGTGTATATLVAGAGLQAAITTNAPGGFGNAGNYLLENKMKWNIPVNGRWSLTLPFTVVKATGIQSLLVELAPHTFGTNGLTLNLVINTEGQGGTEVIGAACASFRGTAQTPRVILPMGCGQGPHTILIESDGRWARAYVDGYLVGYSDTLIPSTEVICGVNMFPQPNVGAFTVIFGGFLLRQTQPFLMRGEDKGDYVLPGGIQTYPYGGLTGRYWNDGDLAGITSYQHLVFAPNRPGTGPGGSYKDRTDARIISTLEPPFPGAPTEAGGKGNYWSARWFGAVYLKLSAGNYTFAIDLGHGGGRLWVGKTSYGAQLIDEWTGGSTRVKTAVLNAASLGGKDGWYPIILEFFQPESAAEGNINLNFTPPASYTDPGGFALTNTEITIPSTSLSPFGCVDQRYQGQSHFTITQDIAAAFGFQMTCVPQQLESGAFPGQLAPHAHVGRETDERLTKDDILSDSPIVNYKSTVDATDQVSSLRAIGSGLPNGQNGQIQVEEYSLPTMKASLFDLQGWVDQSGTNSPTLLAAACASQLELQSEPWQNVEGEPLARDRLTDTFPLTGALAAMRWRPGDGVRIWLPSINVEDLTPRQIMQVTRQFGPLGRHATQMGFRQRPIDRVSQINRLLRGGRQAQRSYQKQAITLPTVYQKPGEFSLAAGEGTFASVPLHPGDTIISATLMIVTNTAKQKLTIENLPVGSYVPCITAITAIAPLVLNVAPLLVCRNAPGESAGAAYIRAVNAGTEVTGFGMHLHVVVLR